MADAKAPIAAEQQALARRAVWRATWILLPTVMVTGMLAYIDRSNVAYAAFKLKQVVKINNSQYGLASGILYISYCFFQVPSQLVVRRVGAPIWLAVLVVGWGIVAAATAAVQTVGQFYALRFLLGVFESGTFPAIFYHLSLFFTESELSLAYSLALLALPLSQVIGGPIAGGLQFMEGKSGLHGYQWLFIIEGVITVLWGFALPWLLPASPQTARLLTPEEREFLAQRQQQLNANANNNAPHRKSFFRMFLQWKLWYYAIMGFLVQCVLAGCIFFVPLIVDAMFSGQFNGKVTTTKIKTLKQLNWQIAKVSLIASTLYVGAAVASVTMGWSSKRLRERNWHVFLGLAAGGICFMCVPVAMEQQGAIPAFVVMCLAAAGLFGTIGPLCSWIVTLLHGTARVLGFGLFNAVGGIGAFAGPTIIGKLSNTSGSWPSSLYFLGACCLASAFMALLFRTQDITASITGADPPVEAFTVSATDQQPKQAADAAV